jgi:hypothetical protein
MTAISDPPVPVAVQPEAGPVDRVGWQFISLYTLAYISTCLVFIAPALVTLALKVNSIEGFQQAAAWRWYRDRCPGGDVRQSAVRSDE